MKLFLALLSPLVFGAVTIDHQKASELLKREPRANEGLSEVRILSVELKPVLSDNDTNFCRCGNQLVIWSENVLKKTVILKSFMKFMTT